jgi:hypothetical protein
MKTPCEIVVKTLLPTVRAEIARRLVSKHGMNQAEAAEKLGVTTAAVSQYLSERRATKRDLEPFRSQQFRILIQESAAKIASSTTEMETMREFCSLCCKIRSKGLICELHREASPGLDDCSICMQDDANSGT